MQKNTIKTTELHISQPSYVYQGVYQGPWTLMFSVYIL